MQISLVQIGIISSPFKEATGTPIQPSRAQGIRGTVRLLPEYVEGLKDLEGFERIWLLYWFDRATAPQLRVTPYRDTVEHGIFATRVPPRPNPIGMSCVRLLRVEQGVVEIADVDVLDGTPLLDIKPYVPQYDQYPVQRCGWLDGVPQGPGVADARFERGKKP